MQDNLKRVATGFRKFTTGASGFVRNHGHAYSIISASGLFDTDYYLTEYPDVAAAGVDPIRHYINHGAGEFRNPSPHFTTRFYAEAYPDVTASGMNPLVHYIKVGKSRNRWASHKLAVQKSGFFDPVYYLMNNPDVGLSGLSPIDHYVTHGWRQWRNPCAAFDLIWYAQIYLRSNWAIDPLFHYVVTGADKGHKTRPPLPIAFQRPTSYRGRADKPRRICLFAGYDADGLIDPVVIEYISELALHADVYYLADCYIAPDELAKLDCLTKGAWAERHGRYDFGSWSILAQKLVGWDTIDGYDELVLANDSCFLMRPLEDVFTEMDDRDCDWWGLQATKGIISTFDRQALPEAIDLDTIKKDWLAHFEGQGTYDFLVGSYFLVLRKPVFSDECVRDLLHAVQEEYDKLHLIRKYEIGLTRLLISLGYDFETFVRTVYPDQPIYTDTAFSLLEDGFPLLKKYHLIENHYKVRNLGNWHNRVRQSGIDKDLTPYEENLKRTGDASKIYSGHDIELYEIFPPLSEEEMISLDAITPKYDNWWAFPVCAYNHLFNDNIRALFEHVKSDPNIKKIVLTRSKSVDLDGVNVVVAPLHSREGQFHLLRARHVFLKHGVGSNLGVHLSPELHCFHNLWHGIPLKQIGYASLDTQGHLDHVANENRYLTSVIAASKVDRNAMATAYWPLTINDIWLTGLPRHDLILKSEKLLPNDLKGQLARLRNMLGGKKFILFAPTFRHGQQAGYYAFSPAERDTLASLLKRNGYVMGVREHMADRVRQYTSRLCGDEFLSVPESLFPCVEVLLREADIVATDYSSVFIDFLLTGRPVISFAYDYDQYVNKERGLFYDLEWAFPGKIARTFGQLCNAIEASMSGMNEADFATYDQRRKLFIEHYDDGNSARVIERVQALGKGDITALDIHDVRVSSGRQKSILWVYGGGPESPARLRTFNLATEMDSAGWNSRVITDEQFTPDHLKEADVIVFCDVSVSDEILDLAEGFRRADKVVVLDITAPAFDRALLEQTADYRAPIEQQTQMRRQCAGLQKLMETANIITVPVPAMVRLVEQMGMRAMHIPNCLSPAIISRYSKEGAHTTSSSNGLVRICCLAPSPPSNPSFQTMLAAVRRILSEVGNTEFHLLGTGAELTREDDRMQERWVCRPYPSYDAMHDFLESVDINLAPSSNDILRDYESEFGLVEAGLHSIPTIASPSEPHAGFLQNGKRGLIASSEEEWYQALKRLITDTEMRQRSGSAARNLAIKKFSSATVSSLYRKDILEKLYAYREVA